MESILIIDDEIQYDVYSKSHFRQTAIKLLNLKMEKMAAIWLHLFNHRSLFWI